MRRSPLSRSRAGQLPLFALLALAVVVALTAYLFLASRSREREAATARVEGEQARDEQVKLERAVSSLLDDAINEAVDEMAAHAGFTEENAPLGHPRGVPYLFDRGRRVNVPSVPAMEGMLAEEVARRVAERRDELVRTLGIRRLRVGAPNATAQLHNESVRVALSLPLSVQGEGGPRSASALSFDRDAPLRLKRLRDLAVSYVESYERLRTMESYLLTTISQDSRIWGPHMRMRGLTSCADIKKVHRTELAEPFRQNAKLAVAMELDRVRRLQPREDLVAWSAAVDELAVNFTLLANAGTDKESTEVIEEIPLPFLGAQPSCFKEFSVEYNVSFPVEVRIRDLKKSAGVVGGEGSAGSKQLELVFYVRPFLREEDPAAVDPSVTDPAEVTGLCQGSCRLDLGLHDSGGRPIRSARVYVDSCMYEYPSPGSDRLVVRGAPCGLHTIVAESVDPAGKARAVERANILPEHRADVAILDLATLGGVVAMRTRVLCMDSKRVEDRPDTPLGYVDGSPPTYIKVVLAPLDPRMGEPSTAVADERGRFSLQEVVPGRYLALFIPSMDRDGRPGYKVLPAGRIVAVNEGSNDIGTVSLDPMFVEPLGSGYVRIASKQSC